MDPPLEVIVDDTFEDCKSLIDRKISASVEQDVDVFIRKCTSLVSVEILSVTKL